MPTYSAYLARPGAKWDLALQPCYVVWWDLRGNPYLKKWEAGKAGAAIAGRLALPAFRLGAFPTFTIIQRRSVLFHSWELFQGPQKSPIRIVVPSSSFDFL